MSRELFDEDWTDHRSVYDKRGLGDTPRKHTIPRLDGDGRGHGDGDDHLQGACTPPVTLEQVVAFEADVMRLFNEARHLMLQKHSDYGPKNISDAPGGAMNGLLVRMHDKMARLNHLTYVKGGGPDVDESVEDTLLDLANYSLIAILVKRGHWPGSEK